LGQIQAVAINQLALIIFYKLSKSMAHCAARGLVRYGFCAAIPGVDSVPIQYRQQKIIIVLITIINTSILNYVR
jgi:hypothetical protein